MVVLASQGDARAAILLASAPCIDAGPQTGGPTESLRGQVLQACPPQCLRGVFIHLVPLDWDCVGAHPFLEAPHAALTEEELHMAPLPVVVMQ